MLAYFFPFLNYRQVLILQVCRCISELCRHKPSYGDTILSECKARSDIPSPEVESLLVSLNYLILLLFSTILHNANNMSRAHV